MLFYAFVDRYFNSYFETNFKIIIQPIFAAQA